MSKRLTQEEFIVNSIAVHGNKYDYSKATYTTAISMVTIVCPTHGEFNQIPNAHTRGQGCPMCAKENKILSNNIFISKANIAHNNKFNYAKTVYINTKSQCIVTCPTHGDFTCIARDHLTGRGCLKCSIDASRKSTTDFISEAINVHGDLYDYSMVEYRTTITKVPIICPTHGIFYQQPRSHITGIGCPKCKSSKGEIIIRNWLVANNRKFIEQHTFPTCVGKQQLRFDFYDIDSNTCIEYDGKQHYQPIEFYGGEKSFLKTQKNDLIKNTYCQMHSIQLIRIPYWDIKNIPTILDGIFF